MIDIQIDREQAHRPYLFIYLLWCYKNWPVHPAKALCLQHSLQSTGFPDTMCSSVPWPLHPKLLPKIPPWRELLTMQPHPSWGFLTRERCSVGRGLSLSPIPYSYGHGPFLHEPRAQTAPLSLLDNCPQFPASTQVGSHQMGRGAQTVWDLGCHLEAWPFLSTLGHFGRRYNNATKGIAGSQGQLVYALDV